MPKKNNKICIICGLDKTERQMAKHRNKNINDNYGFCKDCTNEYTDGNDVSNVIDMLRIMNVPFVEFVWENALEKGGSSAFSKYLQLIATQKKFKDFSDNDFDNQEENGGSRTAIDINDDIIAKWGIDKEEAEYIELELLYNSLLKIKEPATLFEEKRYVQNVKLGKAVDTALEDGDVKTVPQLRKAYADDLKDLGLDIKQSSEENERTLGMRIADWEKNSPIPDDKEFDDVDNISDYINKWFLIPMKRVFGRASEEEVNKLYE